MILQKTKVVLLCAFIGFVWCNAAQAASVDQNDSNAAVALKEPTCAKYQIYIVDPPINNYAIQEHKPLPITCQPGTKISMMACRGEYEPACFVIETDSKLENVLVTVGQLAGNSGAIPSSAVDVRVVQPCWLRITDDPGRMNWLLLHDPSLLKIVYEANEVPFTQGMSFTRTPIDTSTLQPADINSRQQFWLTVHVPADAKAGTYTGTISITAANAPTQTLTLELTVPDIDLLEPNFEYSQLVQHHKC